MEALTFCVEATLGSEEEEEKVRSDGEKQLLGLRHVPSPKPPRVED